MTICPNKTNFMWTMNRTGNAHVEFGPSLLISRLCLVMVMLRAPINGCATAWTLEEVLMEPAFEYGLINLQLEHYLVSIYVVKEKTIGVHEGACWWPSVHTKVSREQGPKLIMLSTWLVYMRTIFGYIDIPNDIIVRYEVGNVSVTKNNLYIP